MRKLLARFFLSIYITIKAIDIRDVFFFSGLILLGYGLFLFIPWCSFTVCGLILMIFSLIMKAKI